MNSPTPALTLASLRGMNAVVVAQDPAGQVLGFAAGLTDGVMVLYVWDLCVRKDAPEDLKGRLLGRLLERFGQVYQVNAHPSREDRPLFEQAGFVPYAPQHACAMTIMRMDLQDGGSQLRA